MRQPRKTDDNKMFVRPVTSITLLSKPNSPSLHNTQLLWTRPRGPMMQNSEIGVPVETENVQSELKETRSLIGAKGWSKFTSLNGTSRAFTISVLTTVALGITTLYFDREFLEHEDGGILDRATPGQALSAAGRQIIRALTLLIICLVIAMVAFGLMAVNVYPFKIGDETRQRIWMITAVFCAIFCSALGAIVIVDTEIKFQERKDENETFQSAPAHYFLVSCFGLSLIWMDYLFVTVVFVGKYLELQQRESGWATARKNLSRIISLGRKTSTEQNQTPKTLSFRQKVTSWCWNSFTDVLKMIVDGVYHAVLALQHCLGVKTTSEEEGITENKWKSFSISFSNIFIDTSKAIRNCWILKALHRIITFIFWDLWKPLRSSLNHVRGQNESDRWQLRGSAQIVQMFDAIVSSLQSIRYSFRNTIDDLYDSVREEEEFKHSGWVLAAILTSLVLLIYFGVAAAMNMSAYLNEVYMERRNCAVRTFEDTGELGNWVLRIAGFNEASDQSDAEHRIGARTLQEAACSADFTSDRSLNLPNEYNLGPESTATDLLAVMNATDDRFYQDVANFTSRFQYNLSDDRIYSCPLDGFSASPCYSLSVINALELSLASDLNESRTPTDVFHDHAIGKTVYLLDAMLRHVRYTIWIGWMVGLVVGIYSLLSVLGQYKRLSLAIRSGLFTDLNVPPQLKVSENREVNIRRAKSVITENHWSTLIELYPMGFSVFFFGILVSTAVIQLFVFGSAISLLLAFLVSIFDEHVFAILRPFLAMLIAFLITWAINGPIAQRVISEGILVKRYHIYHEFTFLMFLLVYTALHLVLGVFIALFRLIWVLLTTIASLNRLDKNLFPLLKGNDLGHKSFMSMILTNHAFQSNACTEESLARQVIHALQDGSPSSDDEESKKKDTKTPSETQRPESKTYTFTFPSPADRTSYDDLPQLPIV